MNKMKELSIIKLFGYVQKAIEKIDTYPLAKENLDVNSDSYADLGSDSDEDLMFAHIGVDYTKRHTDLAFGMIFSKSVVGLSVGGHEYVFVHYDRIGRDEKDIAEKLTSILIGLANGQLAILCTVIQDNEKIQAWEILYRKTDNQFYDALSTYAMFDSARKLKNRELTTRKFANTANIRDIDVDIDTFRLFMFETTWLNKFNRKQINGLHIPLTRENWERSVDKYYDEKADAFIEKVDVWAEKDKKGFRQQVLDAAKWRHIELMWWSLALLMYKTLTEWSLERIEAGFVAFGVFVVVATVYRRRMTSYRHSLYIRLSAYVGFALSAFIFASYFDGSFWWYVLGALGLLALIENISFDIYAVYTRFFAKSQETRD